jgi:hypothetical protein
VGHLECGLAQHVPTELCARVRAPADRDRQDRRIVITRIGSS